MDKNLPEIENLFKSNLDDNEEMPSSKVWDDIEQTLDRDNIYTIKKKYSNLKRVAVILLALLTGLTIYDLHTRYTNKELVKTNLSVNAVVAKSKNYRNNTNRNSPHRIDSLKLSEKIKGSTAEDLLPLSKEDQPFARLKNVQRKDQEYVVINDSMEKTLNILNRKNNVLLLQNNKTVDKKNEDAIENKIYHRDQNHQPGHEHEIFNAESGKNKTSDSANHPASENNLLINDHMINIHQKSFLSEISSLQYVRGKLIDSLISRIKLQPSVTVKSTANLNDDMIKNKRVQKEYTKKELKLSALLFFSPDFAWYRLQDDVPDNQLADADEIEKGEQHEFSSSVGALIDYKLNKHWAIQSGLTFSNTAITAEPKTIYAQADNTGFVKYRFNSSSGYSYLLPPFSSSPSIGDSLYAFTSIHTLQYIGIPFAIKYDYSVRKFTFNAMLGVYANILTKGKIETILEKGTSNESEINNDIQGLKSAYLSGLIGAGAEYNLSKRIAVTFIPTTRLALSAINKGAVVKSYPNSVGFATGIRIKL